MIDKPQTLVSEILIATKGDTPEILNNTPSTINELQNGIASKVIFALIATWSIYKIMKGSLRFGEPVYTKDQIETLGIDHETGAKLFKAYLEEKDFFTFRGQSIQTLETQEECKALTEEQKALLKAYLTMPEQHMNEEGKNIRNQKKSMCIAQGEAGLLAVALGGFLETQDLRYLIFEGFIALNSFYALWESYKPEQTEKLHTVLKKIHPVINPQAIIIGTAIATFCVMAFITKSFQSPQEAALPLGLTTIALALGLDAKWEKLFPSLLLVGSGIAATTAGIDAYNHITQNGITLGAINSATFCILDTVLAIFIAKQLLIALKKHWQKSKQPVFKGIE